jgi:hypothetical protein
MTACWCRLTQPETSRRKKVSGGGSESMPKRDRGAAPGSRGASLAYRRPADRPRFPRHQPGRRRRHAHFRRPRPGPSFRPSRDCTAASDFATHRDVRDLTRRCAFTETVWRGCRGDPIGRHPVELGRNRCIYPFERPASNMIQADRRWIAHRQMSHRGWTTVAGVDASPPWVSLRDRSQGHPPGPPSIPA